MALVGNVIKFHATFSAALITHTHTRIHLHAHKHTHTHTHTHILLLLLVIHQLTDDDGNLLLVGVSEDDSGYYQCSNSVGNVSVGYHLDVEGYSGQSGMCCYYSVDT